MLTIGLTGGIATGKSTVADMLRAREVPVLDADAIARVVVAPGTPGLAAIVAAFGASMLQGDGSLDRKALGAVVMADADARKQLEGITHPAIIRTLLERLAALMTAGERVAVVEAALMVESGSYQSYAELWVVTCDPDTQRHRLMARNGFDDATARRWIGSQLPLANKEALADRLLRNDGTRDALQAQVTAALDAALSGSPSGA